MFKHILIVSLLSVALFSALTKEEIINQLKMEGSLNDEVNTETNIKSKRDAKATSSKTYNDDTYIDVVLFNMIRRQQSADSKEMKGPSNIAKKREFLANNEAAHEDKLKQLQAQEVTAEQKEGEQIYNLSGYCTILNELEVERLQVYSLMDCKFEENDLGIRNSKLLASFVPIFNKLALLGKPIYLRLDERKLPIENGIMLTVDQTNLNLATFINDTRIKDLIADTAIKTNEIVYNSSVQYLEEKKLSDTTEELVIAGDSNNLTTTKATNTKAPDIVDYALVGGIQILSSIIGGLGNYYKDNNYPLYKVERYTQIFIDFNIKMAPSKKSMIDYRTEDHNSISKDRKNYIIPNN